MTEQRRVQLGDHVDLKTGFPFKSDGYNSDGAGVRLLRGDNIGQGKLRWSGAKFWPEHVASEYAAFALRLGDVVLAMDRPWIEAGLKYATVRAADVPSLLVQRVARLRAGPQLDQRFLAYVIADPRFTAYVRAVQTGTAVPHISGVQIRQYEFDLLPIAEQRAIADVLSAFDDKIEANESVADLSEQLAVAHMSAAASEAAVGHLAVAVRRQLPVQSFAESSVAHYSLPAYDAARLPEDCLGKSLRSGKFTFSAPSVLVSRLNPRIPRIWHAVSPPDGVLALASTEFVVLAPAPETTSQELWAAAASDRLTLQLLDRVTGTSGSHQRVRLEDILDAMVPDPRTCSREARALIRALVDRALDARRESRALARMRDELLPALMTGQLRACEAGELVEEAV